jgi:hypothetical protein
LKRRTTTVQITAAPTITPLIENTCNVEVQKMSSGYFVFAIQADYLSQAYSSVYEILLFFHWKLVLAICLVAVILVGVIPFRVWGQPPDLTQEEAAYQQALQYIEQHRKNDVAITVLDSSGHPVKNLNVTYQQTSHDFKFGFEGFARAAENNPQARRTYSDLCTFMNATIKLIWNQWPQVEPQRGVYRWDTYDNAFKQELSLCPTARFVIVFRTLAEADPYNPYPSYPAWANMQQLSNPAVFDQFKKDLHDYVYQNVKRYGKMVDYWITETEPDLDPSWTVLMRNIQNSIDVDRVEVQAIRDAQQDAKVLLMVGFDLSGSSYAGRYVASRGHFLPYDFARNALSSGLRVDGFSVEAYPGGPPNENENHTPLFYRAKIQQLQSLGKGVFIQEGGYPAYDCQGCHWKAWGTTYDETMQADWVKYMATLPFGMDNTLGDHLLTMVDFSTPGKVGEFDEMGLFTQGGDLRQSYSVFLGLMQMFRTKGSALTDDKGQISFRGFAGYYTVTAKASSSQRSSLSIHVQQLSNSTYTRQQNFVITFLSQGTTGPTMSKAVTSTTETTTRPIETGTPSNTLIVAAVVTVAVVAAGVYLLRRKRPTKT